MSGARPRLRVGLVCPYDLDVPGGVREQVLGLAAALTDRGHDVEVVGPRSGVAAGRSSGPLVRSAGRVVALPTNGSTARLALGPLARSSAAAWAVDGGFDVVHVHEPIPPGIGHSVLRRLARDREPGRGPAVAATVHVSLAAHPAGRSFALRTAAGHVRSVLRGVDVLTAVSEHARRTVVDHLGRSPLVVPNGVDVAGWAAAGRGAGPRAGAPTAVVLGRAGEPRKGVDVLLRAWREVRRQVPDARLLVVGPSEGVPLPARAGVVAVGAVPEAEKRRLVATADVLVAPHRGGESFGLVLVEAMSVGTPVVASDLPAFRDVLAGTGTLVPVGDSDAVAAAVVGVLADPGLARSATTAARDRAAVFSWPAVAARWEETYDLALRLHRPDGPRHVLAAALRERARVAADVADALLADALLADALLADASLADASLADASLADASLADASLAGGSTGSGAVRTAAALAGVAAAARAAPGPGEVTDPSRDVLAAHSRLSRLGRDLPLPDAARGRLAGATARLHEVRGVVNDLARRDGRPTVELDDAVPALPDPSAGVGPVVAPRCDLPSAG